VAFDGNQFAMESLEKRMVLITKDVGKLDDRASSWEKKLGIASFFIAAASVPDNSIFFEVCKTM
jgi:hypothetical protein